MTDLFNIRAKKMKQGYTNETVTFAVTSATTGLTDLELVIIKPDGTAEASNTALSELGANKIYSGDYLPTVDGVYYAKIVSPTDSAIDGRVQQLTVKPVSKLDLGGAGFDSSTDGLSVIAANIAQIQASAGSGDNGFI